MGYQALYREWRPQEFRDLVGQEHISKTLQNAFTKGRIAHAYLFCGPRGTGKTSTAKILAKVVNCLAPVKGEPCNRCENCEQIKEGRFLDVIEIDAASNRGIDEIREIRERVHFVPTQGKYKVYIIDEVHMLTGEAFNALLKTLEEPPAHIIFILATTEPQKIPATILSRCQRFDFRRISPGETETRLRQIMDALEVTAEDGVLDLIVKKADGGLRDAISILDQCLSFSSGRIMLETAYDVLGLVKGDALAELAQAIIDKDAAKLLRQVNDLIKQGIEPGQILKDFIEHLRNLLLLSVCGADSQLVLQREDEKAMLMRQAGLLGVNRLSKIIAVLTKTDAESRWRQNMRIVLETTLIGLLLQDEEQARSASGQNAAVKATGADQPAQKTSGRGGNAAQGLQYRPTDVKTTVLERGSAPELDEERAGHFSSQEFSSQEVSFQEIAKKWPLVMDAVKERKRTVHAFLNECQPGEVSGMNLLLVFKPQYTFHKEQIEAPQNKKLIEDVLFDIYGVKLNIVCVFDEESKKKKEKDPVQIAIDLFGADVVD